MEKVVVRKITTYLEENSLMNPHQHGFRHARSTLSQLLEHYENLVNQLEDGNVDVVNLDMAKAFDKADHGAILHELREVGIGGSLACWIDSFLSGRTQRVKVSGCLSSSVTVTSGVPQGSVLGPLLFIILMRSIDKNVHNSMCLTFADDTKLISKITSTNDAINLQADLDSIYQWTRTTNMDLNSEKFQLLRYGKNAEIKEETSYKSSSGAPIVECNVAKDLGIIMDNTGEFKIHCELVIRQANFACGQIMRTFKTRAASPMLHLYRSLVLSKLDYCSPLWSPMDAMHRNRLESDQRSFTRKIENMSELNYWQRLNRLGLYSIQRRHERYMILYVFRMIHGLTPNVGIQWSRNPRTGLHVILPKLNLGANSSWKRLKESTISVRGAKLYNSILPELRQDYSTYVHPLEVFKKKLDHFLRKVPDEPTCYGISRRAQSNSLIDQVVYANQC